MYMQFSYKQAENGEKRSTLDEMEALVAKVLLNTFVQYTITVLIISSVS